ncbi:Uncharacterised protein [Kingella potus]|uniref:Uncharacterized protein n=1 Tax=Kingella potus TaxID=265175 RepID=A0A377R1Z1_9NEIS|nr:hypothetical protein [Kingella potus]UOP01282.1 hypothetical protein LVJ84_03205 [Kingella potus]STR01010.1 Uncharacterised protein [Kingella potus]
MDGTEQRLEYLEEAVEMLRMQNRVLGAAFNGLLRGLPADTAQDVTEAVRQAFEDTLAELEYADSAHADLFHDATYTFFREKE